MILIFETILQFIVVFYIIYIAIVEYNRTKEWADKFKEGMRIYTIKEEGTIICIKGLRK